jgi:hypothetical protein
LAGLISQLELDRPSRLLLPDRRAIFGTIAKGLDMPRSTVAYTESEQGGLVGLLR